jgi:Zn-dependent protease
MNAINEILFIAPPILIALAFHEYAHAYVANRFGDPTARLAGRLTLNPLKHLDVLGTIMLFIVNFGWAKPVPVDPSYFRNPRRDMLYVALAGPLANMLLAFVFGIGYRLIDVAGLPLPTVAGIPLIFMLRFSIFINLVLAFFNLIPIPPLDGSKILRSLLPVESAQRFIQFEAFGPFLLLGLIVLGRVTGVSILWSLIGPPVDFFSWLFAGIKFGHG